MKISDAVLGLTAGIIHFIIKLISYPFSKLFDFKPDFQLEMNYGAYVCHVVASTSDPSGQMSSEQLTICYLQYLLKMIVVLPPHQVAIVTEVLGECIASGYGHKTASLRILKKVEDSLSPGQKRAFSEMHFPLEVSALPPNGKTQWRHTFKITKFPNGKIGFNYDSSPMDVLLPLSCSLLYGYVCEKLSEPERMLCNFCITDVLVLVKKYGVENILNYKIPNGAFSISKATFKSFNADSSVRS